MGDLIFLQEILNRRLNMKSAALRLDVEREHLFAHVTSDCDTTLAPLLKGKASFLNLVKKSEEIKDISDTMVDFWANQSEMARPQLELSRLCTGKG